MNDDVDLNAHAHATPFVGMRAYERHEGDLLTGRDEDATILVDKVFSSRLTLLYAPSGLGKSSLLKALVIPRLEKENCRAIYFDAWACEEPERALKRALLAQATTLGLGDVLGESATLADWVRLVTTDHCTLVLVLDQFEEFLVNHAQRLDPMRKELAALVRTPDLDLRLLIALREEFLANLEPLREQIVNIFQSTYRLEPLREQQVRDAVRRPAERFGVSCEDLLLDALVSDLCVKPAVNPSSEARASVDLPMLQIVCLELWLAATARGQTTLTAAFYRGELGGAPAILDAYIRKVMPCGWRDQQFTARLMTCLAPPSGLKISYALSDLVAMTGLDQERIHRELHRLAGKEIRVLRIRDFAGGERFELQHDALIPRIAPWRDRILARRHWMQRGAVAASVVAAIAAGVGWKRGYDNYEMHRYTERSLALLRCDGPRTSSSDNDATLDGVASYLLRHKRGEQAWDRLQELMMRHEACIAPSYGRVKSEIGTIQLLPQGESWPIVLRVSENRRIDEEAFHQSWVGAAARLTHRLGVPVPRRTLIVRDPSMPLARVQLESGREPMAVLDLAEPDGEALVNFKSLPALVLVDGFRSHFTTEWKPWLAWNQAMPGAAGTWWSVPRWSLPAWKAVGVRVYQPSEVLALALEDRLQRDPESVLTEGAQRFMLTSLGVQCDADSAKRDVAYCRRQRHLLRLLVVGSADLRHTALVMEGLGDLRESRQRAAVETFAHQGYVASLAALRDERIAGAARAQRSAAQMPVLRERAGATRAKDTPPPVRPRERAAAYKEMQAWLPVPPQPIRVVLGERLFRSWVSDNKSLAPWLPEAVADAKDRSFARLGIRIPGVRFQAAAAGELGPLEYRIALLDQDNDKAPPSTLPNADATSLEQVLGEVSRQVDASRAAWVSKHDITAVRDRLAPDVKKWLVEHYSESDLRLVARAVLLPEPGADAHEPGPGQSLRHADWLLGGLVVWDRIGGEAAGSVSAAATFLRELQQARLAGAPVAPRIDPAMARAAAYLVRGQVDLARKAFARTVADKDMARTRSRFASAYAEAYRSMQVSEALVRCKNPLTPPEGDPEGLRADLFELLQDRKSALPPNVMRQLALCKAAALPDDRTQREFREAAEAAALGTPDAWPAQQARWLALKLLKKYDPLRDLLQWRDLGVSLFGSALRRLSIDEGNELFSELLQRCNDSTGPRNWCWPVARGLALTASDNPWVALSMAYALVAVRPPTEGVGTPMEWLGEADRRMDRARMRQPSREPIQRWIRYIRAEARYERTSASDTTALAAIDAEMAALADSPLDEQARFLQIQIAFKRQSWAAAEQLASAASERYPGSAEFLSEAFFAALLQGKQPAVGQYLLQIEQRLHEVAANHPDRDNLLFLAALGRLLVRDGDWELLGRQFLQTSHPYVNVVAILMHNHMSGQASPEADILIQRRWRVVDRSTWDLRMRAGDASAWFETMLGFYLGEVPRDTLLHDLEDDASFARSPYARLPYERKGLLSDAYFYDALRMKRNGDLEGMNRSLQRVTDIGVPDYYEYRMARYFLARF